MGFNLKGRSLLTLKDYSPEEIKYLLSIAKNAKEESRAGVMHQRFLGKTIALIFEKRSTRTRCAFETAFGEEGGHPVFLSTQDIQLGAKESIEDTARVLGRMFNAIEFRGFKQETVEALAKYSGIPVYNGLTDLYHPTQVLADLLTIQEEFGTLKGVKIAYVGDGRNNMANSLIIGCAKMGLDFTIVAPKKLWPEEKLVTIAKEYCKTSQGLITLTEDPKEGVKDAQVIYTDVWASMGEEDKMKQRMKFLSPYQVNQELMKSTGRKDTIFLHCLPAVKEKEVTTEVMEGYQSRVWDQAENRKHTIKAIMLATI
ncbi:ornithine carbamoyltransferase [Garciella nitratireducens]|uniref:ornithine carbamoyltransferase n=1 Tax=Garciella nitratireducens TaxID=218205 RepID=UPI000DE9BBF9|nr:ornithine carbamoyltransferase [Garciella nitratireducens]RBP46890.1 ornithine carbamoyltransferase [Garciella nitratireducens]